MYAWILQHDDRWSFIALYVGLAVVLSMWISLFWLVALVSVHFGFECVRQHAGGARGRTLVSLAAWEVKLDVALVLFALALTLYMEVVLGVLGLHAAARGAAAANASVRAGSRLLGWERALRGVLLSVDDVAQVGRVAARRGGESNGGAAVATLAAVDAVEQPAAADQPAETAIAIPTQWGVGDRVAIVLGAACIMLILAAPLLNGGSYTDAATVMLAELRPFPQ